MRALPIGPRCLLVELADLDATLALFAALEADPVPGIDEIVPAARTLMIQTAPGVAADRALARAIRARMPEAGPSAPVPQGDPVEIPMRHDGEDLDEVAALMGLDRQAVIRVHAEAVWRVAFCGFAPGFAYMTCDDPRFDLPRRATPRTRIPAGAVALAGRFCGVYPKASPGGWQLIGTTDLPMFDLRRHPPAILRPGMQARFVPAGTGMHPVTLPDPPVPEAAPRDLKIEATPFPILIQDGGRAGQAGQGVSASGALDRGAARRANRAVGNPPDDPVLEITLGPVRMRAGRALTLALTGAGRAAVAGRAIPDGAAFAMDAGDVLTIGAPIAGMRSYLALRGGLAVARVMGSASTDTLAQIGPPALQAGDALAWAARRTEAAGPPQPGPALPQPGALVELAVTLGPRADWFTPEALADFLAQDWTVTPQSSRVGIRLQGRPILREGPELPSEGTATGAIQVPHSGQPVLFLADHPLTGGYPVIATLRPEALDLAGQLPPGTRIRFRADAPFAPILSERSDVS